MVACKDQKPIWRPGSTSYDELVSLQLWRGLGQALRKGLEVPGNRERVNPGDFRLANCKLQDLDDRTDRNKSHEKQ